MRLVVDPPELHRAADKFTQLGGEYTSVYNRLLNTASTMGEAWKAADNLAFVDQINGFCDDLNSMVQHLNQASQALTRQAQNYEATRDNNVTSVRTLAN
jgi:WXG100 family type VII secretion target